MLAAVLHDFNDLRLEEVPMPKPGPGQVLVKIRRILLTITQQSIPAEKA